MSTLSFNEIKAILPYDFPFLLLDKVIKIEKDSRILCLKNVTGNEVYFLGHFKEEAVMPGVLIIEAIAQAALLLMKYSHKKDNPKYLLSLVNRMRFLKPVFPGDQMVIEAQVLKALGDSVFVSGLVKVNNQGVAKGELIFTKIRDKR